MYTCSKQGSSKDLLHSFHQKKLRLQQHKTSIYSLAGSPLEAVPSSSCLFPRPKPRCQHESLHDSLTSLSSCQRSTRSSTITRRLFLPGKGSSLHELSGVSTSDCKNLGVTPDEEANISVTTWCLFFTQQDIIGSGCHHLLFRLLQLAPGNRACLPSDPCSSSSMQQPGWSSTYPKSPTLNCSTTAWTGYLWLYLSAVLQTAQAYPTCRTWSTRTSYLVYYLQQKRFK